MSQPELDEQDRIRNCCIDLRTHMTELFEGSTLTEIFDTAPYMEIKVNHISLLAQDAEINERAARSETGDYEFIKSLKSCKEYFPVDLDARYLTEDTNYKVEIVVPYFRDHVSFVFVTYFTQGDTKFILMSEKSDMGWKPPNKVLASHLCYFFFVGLGSPSMQGCDINLFNDSCLGVLHNPLFSQEGVNLN